MQCESFHSLYSSRITQFGSNTVDPSLGACAVYYWIWIHVLPKRGKYAIRQTVLILDSGAQTHELVKVPLTQLEDWDTKHDVVGKQIANHGSSYEPKDGSDDGVVRERAIVDGEIKASL